MKKLAFFNILNNYKADFAILFVLCLLYISYIPAWIKEWTNFDSFYSFFPFLIFFGFQFFKIKAEELYLTKLKPTNWGLLALFIGLMTYIIGVKADLDLLSALSLPLLLSGTILFIYGKRIFFIVLPIIILFSISIPVFPVFRLTIPLQIFLAQIVSKILNFFSINAHNLGSSIYIEKYLVTVEAGCTGIKSLSSLLVVNFLLFYFKNISILKKSLILLFSFLLSFFGNIIRILLINFYILYNGMKGAEGFHYGLGLVIFTVSLTIILIINEFIEEDKIEANI